MVDNHYGTKVLKNGDIQIIIPLCPYTKKNHQQILHRWNNGKKVPFISPSKEYHRYAKDCAIFLKPLGIDYPINVDAKFYMNTHRKVDLTNLNEALHDIMTENGTIIDDNYKIIAGTDGSRVRYDKENPRTEIIISRLSEEQDNEEENAND